MKRLSLLFLACSSSVSAEISYEKLYAQTALTTAGLGALGFGLSQLCVNQHNKPWVQGIFCCIAAASGTCYYFMMHPETRMLTNTKAFKSAWESNLFNIITKSFKFHDKKSKVDALMFEISLYYLNSRNPYYNAFEDLTSLKNQYESIFNEARLLLNFYSSDCYKNGSYQDILEEQIELSKKAVEIITQSLLYIKNTPEYKDAVNLQVQIEKQQALERMALAQQTQAFNSYRPYGSTVIIAR